MQRLAPVERPRRQIVGASCVRTAGPRRAAGLAPASAERRGRGHGRRRHSSAARGVPRRTARRRPRAAACRGRTGAVRAGQRRLGQLGGARPCRPAARSRRTGSAAVPTRAWPAPAYCDREASKIAKARGRSPRGLGDLAEVLRAPGRACGRARATRSVRGPRRVWSAQVVDPPDLELDEPRLCSGRPPTPGRPRVRNPLPRRPCPRVPRPSRPDSASATARRNRVMGVGRPLASRPVELTGVPSEVTRCVQEGRTERGPDVRLQERIVRPAPRRGGARCAAAPGPGPAGRDHEGTTPSAWCATHAPPRRPEAITGSAARSCGGPGRPARGLEQLIGHPAAAIYRHRSTTSVTGRPATLRAALPGGAPMPCSQTAAVATTLPGPGPRPAGVPLRLAAAPWRPSPVARQFRPGRTPTRRSRPSSTTILQRAFVTTRRGLGRGRQAGRRRLPLPPRSSPGPHAATSTPSQRLLQRQPGALPAHRRAGADLRGLSFYLPPRRRADGGRRARDPGRPRARRRGRVAPPDHVLYVMIKGRRSSAPPTSPTSAPAQGRSRGRPDDASAGRGVSGSPSSTPGGGSGSRSSAPWLPTTSSGDVEHVDPAAIHPYAGHGTFVAGVDPVPGPGHHIEIEGCSPKGGRRLRVRDRRAAQRGHDRREDPPAASRSRPAPTPATTSACSRFERALRRRERARGRGPCWSSRPRATTRRPPFWPAAFDWVVGVGSLDEDGRRLDFSNYGDWVDVYAHGRDLVNAFPVGTYTCHEPPARRRGPHTSTGMAQWSGTSFSTPVVTGAVAAYMSQHRGRRAARPRATRWSAAAPITRPAGRQRAAVGPPFV